MNNFVMVGKNVLNFLITFFIVFLFSIPFGLGVMSANLDIATLNQTYVPYVGAINNTDLGVFSLYANDIYTNYVDFNTSYTDGSSEGRLQWNSDDGTLEFGMPGGKVNAQISQEMLFRTFNAEGSIIPNGKPILVNGAQGNRLTVRTPNASDPGDTFATIAFTTEDNTVAQGGYVTTAGYVRGNSEQPISCTAGDGFSEGGQVFLGDDGDISPNPATKPNRTVFLGIVKKSHATECEIWVNIVHLPMLEELSNVEGVCSDGQILEYNSASGLWECVSLEIFDEEFLNNQLSAGRLWGGVISQNGATGKINISAGEGLIKTDSAGISCGSGKEFECVPESINDGQGSDVSKVSWDNISGFDLAGVGYNLVYWDASAGTFAVSLKENFYSEFDFITDFTIGRVYYDGTDITIRLCGMNIWNFNRRVQMFGEERFPVERASGLIIGSDGLNITISSGVIWAELVNRFALFEDGNFDSSQPDMNFTYWYRDSSSGWNKINEQSQLDFTNTYWDDGTGVLNTLTPNRYGVAWVYVVHDDTVHIVLGQGNYANLEQARVALEPNPIPGLLDAYATFVGKIIIQEGETSASEVLSPFLGNNLGQTSVTNHNDLSSIQGGSAGEYYHLDYSDYINLINADSNYLKVDGSVLPTDNFNWNGYNVTNVDNLYLNSDNGKIYQGNDDDFSMYYDGTNQKFDLTSGAFLFDSNVRIGTAYNDPKKLSMGYIDMEAGSSSGTLTYSTSLGFGVNYESKQSGASVGFNLKTAEGKTAGFKHYDVAGANGRLFTLFSQPGVLMKIQPSEKTMLELDGFSGNYVRIPGDNYKFQQGAGADYSQYFDGTNQNFDLTSGEFNFNSNITTTSANLKINEGNIVIDSDNNPTINVYNSDTNDATKGGIEFNEDNGQGVGIYHTEFDSHLPVSGYGLIVNATPSNTQFPSVGTLTFNVLGDIYSGGKTISELNKVLTTSDLSYIVKTTDTIDADLVEGYNILDSSGDLYNTLFKPNSGYYEIDPIIPVTNTKYDTLTDPTLAGIAISKTYTENKMQFRPPTNITLSYDGGVTWNESVWTEAEIKKLFQGRYDGSWIKITNNMTNLKFVWNYTDGWDGGYVFLNYLYMYHATRAQKMNLSVDIRDYQTGSWSNIVNTTGIAGWPGHTWIPHDSIPFYDANGRYDVVNVTLDFDWVNPAYDYMQLYMFDWYGSYPANFQQGTYSWNSDGQARFYKGIEKLNVNVTSSSYGVYVNTKYGASNISIYSAGSISAEDFIDRSEVSTDNNVLETFVDGEYLLNTDGTINHEALGSCYRVWEEEDKTRPVIEYVEKELSLNNEIIIYYDEVVTYPYNKTVEGWSTSCEKANTRQALAMLNKNINLYDNLTDFDTGIMAENIYTQSKVMDLNTEYATKFINASILDSKSNHKNKEVLNLNNKPIEVLQLEDRVVDLEGAISDIMNCMATHKKYEDFQVCVLDVNPKVKVK